MAKRGPKGPRKKTPEMIEAILNEFRESSSISTTKACKNHNLSISEWMKWLAEDEKLSESYAKAKGLQAEMLAEEIVEISDICMIGEKVKVKNDGSIETTTGDMVERSKLRVDARKWVAAHLLPKKYGDKINLEHDVSGNLADMMRQHLADSGDSK